MTGMLTGFATYIGSNKSDQVVNYWRSEHPDVGVKVTVGFTGSACVPVYRKESGPWTTNGNLPVCFIITSEEVEMCVCISLFVILTFQDKTSDQFLNTAFKASLEKLKIV